MKRGPLIHGVLLVAALLFAYQTWTREEKVEPTTGDFVLWSMPPESIQSITYVTAIPNQQAHTVFLERRRDEKGPYLWGKETRAVTKFPERDPSTWGFDAGVGAMDSYVPENIAKVYEFAVGERGAKVMEKLAEMRAFRDLGQLDPEQRLLYDFDQPDKHEKLTVTHEGGSHELLIGGKVFGSVDRYALDPNTGNGYVIAHELIRELMTGESSLRMLELHSYKDEDVQGVVIKVGAQSHTLVRTEALDPSGRRVQTWAAAATPSKPDQTMANFLQSMNMLRPAIYESERTTDEMKLLVRVEYQGAGNAPLGWLELYERPPEPEAADGPGGSDGPGEDDGQAAGGAGTGDQPGPEGAGPGGDQAAGKQATGDQAAGKQAGQEADKEADKGKEQKRPVYYMRTELTRVLAAVPFNTASRIAEDIGQIFTPQ